MSIKDLDPTHLHYQKQVMAAFTLGLIVGSVMVAMFFFVWKVLS